MPADQPHDPQLAHATVAALLGGVAARHPRREALVSDGTRLTFAELDARTDRIAQALQDRGIGEGDIVGTLLLDGVPMVELLIATAKLGATILTMNWRLAAPEITYILGDGDPALCFVSACFEPLAREADPACDFIVVPDTAPEGLVPVLGLAADAPCLPPRDVPPGARWYLLYTSGTTGKPKGCMHSQGGYYVNALALMGWSGFRETDRCLLTSPLFHVGGLSNFLSWFGAGACVVIAPRKLDAEGLLQLVYDERITVQTFPLLLTADYLRLQAERKLPLALRVMIGGGGMCPPELLRQIRDTLNVDMILGYGQSEVGGFTSFIRLDDQLERPTSCGKALPHMEVRVVGDDGADLPDGEHGELLVRGAAVTLGYLNRPDADAETLQDGWLHSGDIFWRDEDGFLHYAGRKKELVKTAGENVYPAEVEKVLATHPAVAESCIVGVPDPRFGEAVKAFVVLRGGHNAGPADIADWCRGKIAGYKRPRYVEFVASIPRNFQGKPQRAELARLPVDAAQSTDTVAAA